MVSYYTLHSVLVALCVVGIGLSVGQSQTHQTLTVPEQQPAFTHVGIILGGESGLAYVLDDTGELGRAFDVNTHTGEVLTKMVLDRESVTQPRVYEFLAVTFNGDYVRVRIEITDINDHDPLFQPASLNVEIPEKNTQTALILSASVWDPDAMPNNTRRIEIASGDSTGIFTLEYSSLDNNITYDIRLKIRPGISLDAKVHPNFLLTLKAYDGGGRTGSMLLNVTVLDSNDHEPVFTPSTYSAQVLENATVGTSVLQVTANDADVGDNAKISYSLDTNTEEGRIFNVDPDTGSISLGRELDYETKSSYTFIVKASDHGQSVLTSTVLVSVDVLDVNDNDPVISITFLNGKPVIPENAKPGDFVARVSVSDRDVPSGHNPNVNLTMSGGEGHFGLVTKDNIIYLVLVTVAPDRESRHNRTFDLTFRATDSGSPVRYSVKTIYLSVLDYNDNPPVFSQPSYAAFIDEKSPPGSSVLKVTALDRDEGNNSKISYSIAPTPSTHSDWFRIDTRDGLITTRVVINCETDSHPSITVIAVDGGDTPKSATATVHVTIRDLNDNQPVFGSSLYNVIVPENTVVGTCILGVTARDLDCGVNGQVSYDLQPVPYQNQQAFTIHNKTGQICVASSLDYETRTGYEFSVRAQDRDGLFSTAWIKAEIEDVNDNRPIFYPVTYNVNINENDPERSRLVSVQATDRDSGSYGTASIRFSIIGGNNRGLFVIDTVSGLVSLSRGLLGQPKSYTLTVSAVDGGGKAAIQSAAINVLVTGSTHQPPVFDTNLYTKTESEGLAPNSLVVTVHATNTNPGNGAISYSIQSGDPANYFKIDPLSGEIRVDQRLDHDSHKNVLLNVRAGSGVPVIYGNAQVNVIVTDVNDNPPVFTVPGTVEIKVPENDRKIYTARAHDADSNLNGEVRYKLLANPDGLFVVDSVSGEIRVASGKVLDAETRVKYTVLVQAYDLGTPSKNSNLTVKIDVQDVNDNVPEFPSGPVAVNINESTLLNTKLRQITATDPDKGNNGLISYKLVNDASDTHETFGIFSNDGWIYLRERLDRETRSRYALKIVAYDNGQTSLSSTATITVNILDANDNDPKFRQTAYAFLINENVRRGTTVGRVTATDPDIGRNGEILFSLYTAQNHLAGPFEVSSLGVITTKGPIDREQQDLYVFTLVARDRGATRRSATASVTIAVLDLNDNAPSFLHTGTYKGTVKENQPKGTPVIKVSAIDKDKAENGTVSYYFSDSTPASVRRLFEIGSSSGQITTNEMFDREQRESYDLTVVARDHGQPHKETSRSVHIDVQDMNEPPMPPKSQTIRIKEGIPIGSIVGIVTAVDRDAGLNGKLSYFLKSSQPQNLYTFNVNYSTGTIFNVRHVDYEIASRYMLIVEARDNNIFAPFSVLINVTINVEDINDNSPVFADKLLVKDISEGSSMGHVVHTFVAEDRDSGTNGQIRYSIVSQTPTGYFDINANNGRLALRRPIDRENETDVMVSVKATDQASQVSQRRAGTTMFVARITDVNDNTPVFKSVSTTYILEDEPVHYPILQVFAEDLDVGENGNVTYTIVSGNELGFFRIIPNSGLLLIAKRLDVDCARCSEQYRLKVLATDHGLPSRSSEQLLTINVNDVNDNPPRFNSSVYTGVVSENLPIGTFVTKITAVDDDREVKNGHMHYLIPGGIASNKFAVNHSTGVVYTRDVLDREEKMTYIITAYVRDNGLPAWYDKTTIIVRVLDTNDHVPVFRYKNYPLDVPENQEMNIIHTVVAVDADDGSNGKIRYSITAGNTDNKFSIDPKSGQLSCHALDRENVPQYNLTVTATDSGSPPRPGTCTVTIDVIDLNDNNPIFHRDRYDVTLAENVPVNTTVTKVFARDSDVGRNAEIHYTLESDTGGLFSINPTSGMITTAGHFDREKKSSYIFVVQANDSGVYDPRSQKVSIFVTISDVNDNSPVFTEIPYNKNISTTLGVGEPVITVHAEDKDEGPNGQVAYQFEPDSEYFAINLNTGRVQVKKALIDIRASRVHKLKIKATDQATTNPRHSYGVLNIRVGNPAESMGVLRFKNLTYHANLWENTPVGTVVMTVKAVAITGPSNAGSIGYDFNSGNDHMFRIDNQGRIIVDDPSKLDYETTTRIRLIVVAYATLSGTSNAAGYTTVWINLMDKNDNKPRFSQDRYTTHTYENWRKGSYVMKVSATDKDSGENAHISYSIIAGNCGPNLCNRNQVGAFKIRPSGIIQTNIIIDREVIASYRLIVQAIDNGHPALSSTCTVRVNINDRNDNEPWIPETDPITVTEGTEVGTVIITITANDVDVDVNPKITYNFSMDGNPNNTFSIDRYNGRISLTKPLDREVKTSYLLKIQASDDLHLATRDLIVNVGDKNDNAPSFLQDSYQKLLPEQTKAGVAVITVNATDRDIGENARITYHLRVAPVDGFYIGLNSGTIYTNKTISLTPPTIQLIVTAQDHGDPSLYDVVPVTIQVTDINDHSPVFERPSYSGHVKEDEQVGKTILSIKATDQDDADVNSKIDYSIASGNIGEVFDIISRTGEVSLGRKLDRETLDVYHLVVVATDRGTPPRNSNVTVTVHVDDINDSRPQFVQKSYSVSVPESTQPGTVIVTVKARDADIGFNGKVVYSIDGGNGKYLFSISRESGEISVNVTQRLDHDTEALHELIIVARDSPNDDTEPYREYCQVTINVTDTNDNKPVFPRNIQYEYHVPENEPTGYRVFIAHAEDKDTGLYGRLNYQITEAEGMFMINSITGEVTTAVTFDYESMNSYRFKIIASDVGALQDFKQVVVNITSKDEYAPVFKQTSYDFRLDASTARVADFVGTVHATDQDGGPDGIVMYTFAYPHKYFAIDSSSGNITVKQLLSGNRLKRSVHRTRRAIESEQKLEVRASSNWPHSLAAKAEIVIALDNVNKGGRSGETGTEPSITLILVLVFLAVVAVVFIIVAAVLYTRHRKRHRNSKAAEQMMPVPYDGSFDSVDGAPPPPARAGSLRVGRYDRNHRHEATTSEISNNSVSSGRGSGDDGEDEDDEIRRITKDNNVTGGDLLTRGTMPDSGIQQDHDNLSERSVQDCKEYMAKLGIDVSKIKIEGKPTNVGLTSSVESMHQFEEEGGGEGDGLDIGYLVNAKLGEVEADENSAIMDGTRQFVFNETDPSHAGSLSSVINSEEEFSGSYNWDYLLDWGPRYQPLAHVFAEIARLKDETIQPKKQPTTIVPQGPRRPNTMAPSIKTIPPPLLTNAPPVVVNNKNNMGHFTHSTGVPTSSNATSSNQLHSARTSQMASLSSLPRSPISHESSFTTSPAFSPSFTPTLSPLATRSPSVSPLVTPHGGASSSGHSTPHRTRSNHRLMINHSSESEQELRI